MERGKRVIVLLVTGMLLAGCGGSAQEDSVKQTEVKPFVEKMEVSSPEVAIQLETESMPTSIRFFEREGIWDTLEKVCAAQDSVNFTIDFYNRTYLANIDSTSVGEMIRKAYSLQSAFPLKLTRLERGFYTLVFFGTQYDVDQLTEFLAVATLDSQLEQKGSVKFLSSSWDDYDGSGYYYSVFLNDTSFQSIRFTEGDCVEAEINNANLSKVISLLHEERSYEIQRDGRIARLNTDTLELVYCE
ncbi:MAG: hypothetical protein AB8F95_14835 [Bacteroidia bacterium]